MLLIDQSNVIQEAKLRYPAKQWSNRKLMGKVITKIQFKTAAGHRHFVPISERLEG